MWYFRSVGREEQVGPLDGLAAANFAIMNPGSYCWRMGFIQWLPARAVGNFGGSQPAVGSGDGPQAADVIDFHIHGDDAQFVEIELDPGESAISFGANLIYMDTVVTAGAHADNLVDFRHDGKDGKARVALSSPLAGAVAPVHLQEFGGTLITTFANFIAAARGVAVTPQPLAGLKKGAAGEVFCRLSGDGWAFIHVAGTAAARTLAEGETLKVNAACIAAMTPELNAAATGALGTTTVLTLTGPGRVWLESLSGAPRD
jgi:uncharacterized protein (AIM24 family)